MSNCFGYLLNNKQELDKRENGVLAYIQLNRDHQFGGLVKTLRRWTQPALFFKVEWEVYLKSRQGKMY